MGARSSVGWAQIQAGHPLLCPVLVELLLLLIGSHTTGMKKELANIKAQQLSCHLATGRKWGITVNYQSRYHNQEFSTYKLRAGNKLTQTRFHHHRGSFTVCQNEAKPLPSVAMHSTAVCQSLLFLSKL